MIKLSSLLLTLTVLILKLRLKLKRSERRGSPTLITRYLRQQSLKDPSFLCCFRSSDSTEMWESGPSHRISQGTSKSIPVSTQWSPMTSVLNPALHSIDSAKPLSIGQWINYPQTPQTSTLTKISGSANPTTSTPLERLKSLLTRSAAGCPPFSRHRL